MRIRPSLGIVAAVLLLAMASAHAGSQWDWEELILDGTRRQDMKLKESSLDAVVREAYLAADRPASGGAKVSRLYLLGRAYGKRLNAAERDLANARDVYREVLKLAPECYFAHRDLGILALKTDPPDPRQAEADFRKALTYNKNYVQVLRDLAALCRTQKRHDDAVVWLGQVIRLEPSDVLARAYLAAALIELGKLEEARREVTALQKSAPNNPVFDDLAAELDLAQGRIDEAIAKWKVLMQENPSSPLPLHGLWKGYAAKIKANQHVPTDDLKDVVKRLLLLEQDPVQKKRFQELYSQLDAPPPDPNKPPDDAGILRALENKEEKARIAAAKYVAYREERPSPEIVRGLIGRLGSQRETAPAVREAALRALGRHGGIGTLPVVRLLLADAASNVRLEAALALQAIGSQSGEAARVAFLILARHADDRDPTLAASARGAVLALANGVLEPLEEGVTDTESGRRARWRAWWDSPAAVDAKIRALAVYEQARDHAADEVIAAYVDDPDVFVVKAAYEALAKMADYLPDPTLKAWAGGIVRFLPAEFTPENRAKLVSSLKTWLGSKPRPR